MNNYLQPGNALELIVPAGGCLSGVGYQFGSAASKIVAVAGVTAAAAALATFNTDGVYELPKDTAVDFVAGEAVFFDDGNKEIAKTASTFVPCGTCIETTVASAPTIKVKLSGKSEVVVP